MPKFIVAVTVWLVRRSAPRTGGEADAGWLGRHTAAVLFKRRERTNRTSTSVPWN
jgi:hypothetical protein